jgi:PPK2 family polyphosphate:nucleotide phosphotransferase
MQSRERSRRKDAAVKGIPHASLRVEPGTTVHLADFDPGHTSSFKTKQDAAEKIRADIDRMTALQDMIAAQRTHALLIILAGTDTAGKDGVIKHVMSGVNPQGITVSSFKTPSEDELTQDYLRRCVERLPERGRIGIFNRSYYEEVAVVRVHPELLIQEHLPANKGDIWRQRFADISSLERYLTHNGTIVLKFFLHLSKEEQRKRLLARIDTPEKNWKISEADVRERERWGDYEHVHGDMLTHTSTDWAPWYIIPADHKWFTRLAIADVIVSHLEALHLRYPELSGEARAALGEYRKRLGASRDEV